MTPSTIEDLPGAATGVAVLRQSLSSGLVTPLGSLETTDQAAPGYIRHERYGSVDHDDFAPSLPVEAQFRHSGWAAKRRRIYRALLATHQSCRRVANFGDCGNTLWLHRDGSELALTCNRCHDRLCDPCQRERQSAVQEGILLRCMEATGNLRFVTLTLKHSETPLGLQIDRLISSFKLLRNHPDVGSAMLGGVWFLEVKLDKAGNLWHPHLHCIIEGTFLEKRELSRAWYQTTGDSYIVDIQKIDDPAKRSKYVTKYSTKPLHQAVTKDHGKLCEFLTAIKGRRLYQCFGTWSKAVKRLKNPKRLLTPIGAMNTVWMDALQGDSEAIHWVLLAHGRFPRLARAFPLAPPPHPSP